MKFLILVCLMNFCNFASALTQEERIQVNAQIQKVSETVIEAKENINSWNLKKAKLLLDKISTSNAAVKKIIDGDVVPSSYFCVIDSTNEGQFAGRGSTKLEAINSAITTCFSSTSDNGKSCLRETVQCEREN